MKTNFNKFLNLGTFVQRLMFLTGILFISLSMTLTAQQMNQYSGLVKGADGQPLPGVNVIEKGTTNGTTTDMDGAFNLQSAKAAIVLKFSMVGYTAVEVNATAGTPVTVVLNESTVGLSEVVVVGYGVQKKSLVTGSISQVTASDIKESPASRVDQAIQGLTSGVTVMPTSGSPGAGTQIRIRGVNSNGNSNPLFIVDGMKTGDINNIDPGDIKSVEVLKDAASAAIYGTEGSNGVVLITTKSGKAGKGVVSYDFQYGIQSSRSNMKLMNAEEYAQWQQEAGASIPIVQDGTNTDWLSEIFQSAPMQKHHLSFSGGTEKTKYFLSTSYFDQDGIVGGSKANYNRLTTRFNVSSNLKKWLEVGTNMSYSHSNQQYIAQDNEYRSVVNSALDMDPLTPVTYDGVPSNVTDLLNQGRTLLQDANGNYYGIAKYVTGEIVNPVAFLQTFHNKIKQDKLLGTSYVTLKPIKGLSITSRVGFDMTFQSNHAWNPVYYFSAENQNSMTTIDDNLNKWSRWLWENFASYDRTIGKHHFTALLGYSAEESESPWYYLHSGPMIAEGDQYAYHTYTTSRDFDKVGGTYSRQTMNSIFSRVSYSFMDKYLVEASLRRDAASVFPKNNKSAIFPSVSLGWVLNKEDFFNVKDVSYLKLRGSWGQNGSKANLPGNEDTQFWVFSGIKYPDATDNFQSGSKIDKLTNPDLRWERTQMLDLGFDARFFNDKLSLSADYYNKTTKDLIVQGTGPLSVGANYPFVNGGDVSNKGFEFDLGYTNHEHALKYSVHANFATVKNEVTHLAVNAPIAGANVRGYNLTWFEEGYPIWYFKGYKTNGIDPATGDPVVVDVDGDGQITPADQTNIGNPFPDFTYGATVNLAYKGADFRMFLQGVSGNDIFMGWFRTDRPYSNKPEFMFTDRWTASNTNASMPAANNTSDFVYRSDLMVKDGSYMRIKQIQFGYTMPKAWFNNDIQMLRLYLSLDDFFTFTKYPGLDPEVGSYNPASQGVDRGLYPISGKVMFGLSVKF
jgi:TonB-linked SusC/RagA family outer membrane protein